VAFLQYFTMILNAMLGITRIFVMFSKGEASARRVAGVLAMEEDLTVLPGQDEPEEKPAHIEFRNVSFSYTGIGKNISDLSFRLDHGQTLGILGPTGSGKTTILNLLLRLYDPDEGQVLIDGQDIRTIGPDRLRGKFGAVFQNDFVMEGTVSDNLRMFRDIPMERLEEAARDAQAEFIAQKGGMEADVQVRGNNLSGGQKQRLLIARALAAKPEILILDDASSALDYRTDAKLRRALRENYRDTTTVLVAQRISSLRHADLILVLQDGGVIGAGNHEQLMTSCEEYRHLAQVQMGDGEEEA
jgi:ATP-binding cassette subfamily B protein